MSITHLRILRKLQLLHFVFFIFFSIRVVISSSLRFIKKILCNINYLLLSLWKKINLYFLRKQNFPKEKIQENGKIINQCNFLPYRAIRASKKKRRIILELIASLLAGIFISTLFNYFIKNENSENVKKHEALVKKINLLTPSLEEIKIIKNELKNAENEESEFEIKNNQRAINNLLHILSKEIKDDIGLTEIHFQNNVAVIKGQVLNFSVLDKWLNRVGKSPLVLSQKLIDIQRAPTKKNNVLDELKLFEISSFQTLFSVEIILGAKTQ